MSVSRFRHSTGHVAKPQRQFLNVTPSTAMWDGSNTIACNDEFVAVPWQTFGGTGVFRHDSVGKVPPNPPIFLGQEGPVIDVQFDPFNRQKLFTASEDGSIFGWQIPDDGLTSNISASSVELKGHSKKCGIITFHPSAQGVLGSAALDRVIHIWDVERSTAVTTISSLSDYATGLEWNLDGSLFCATTRDKKLSVMDPRDGVVALSVESQSGARSQRCIWAKRRDIIMTFGSNDTQQRQVKLWDTRKLAAAYDTVVLDQSSAAFMPVYDEDTSLLFIGSKGENNIKCLELMDDGLTFSFEVMSPDPMKGLCMTPKWCLDVKRCEYDRLYQLTYHSLLTIGMVLPRKQGGVEFQSDVFPPTFADKPALTCDEFFNSSDAPPQEYSLVEAYEGHSPRLCAKDEKVAKTMAPEPLEAKNASQKVAPESASVELFAASKEAHQHYSSSSSESVERRVAPSGTKHVDPLSDMSQREVVHQEVRMKELKERLRTFHQEIAALRRQLQEKEREMLEVLEEFQSV